MMDTEAATSYQYKLWNIIGLNPNDKRVSYMLYGAANLISCGLIALLSTMLLPGTREEFFILSFHSMGICFTIIKLAKLKWYTYKSMEWTDATIDLDKRFVQSGEHKQIHRSLDFARIVATFTFKGVTLCVVILEILTLHDIYEGRPALITPIRVPSFILNNYILFWLLHFWQFLALIYISWDVVAVNSFYIIYMSVYTGYLNALSYRVRQIGYDMNKSPTDNYQDLIECIKTHQEILKLFKIIQKSISGIIFLQFFVHVGAQAFLLTYFNYAKDNYLYVGIFIVYPSFELALPCLFGTRLQTSGEKLAEAIYQCNWEDQDIKFRKVLRIFFQIAQNEEVVLVGGIFYVNVETLLKRFSYLTYCFLQSI